MDNDCNRDYETDKLYSELVPELRATIAELRAEVERLTKNRCENCGSHRMVVSPPGCPRCGAPNCCQMCCIEAERDRMRGEMETLTKERRVLDEDMASTERRLKAALIELRCPDCKCSDQIDAESSECGCDSPVCSRDGSMTLAEAYVKALSDRNPPPGHLRDEKGVDRRVHCKYFDATGGQWDGHEIIVLEAAASAKERSQ